MSSDNSNSIVNLGKLSKPVNTLIEKVSNAVGDLYEPHHIKRIAKAKAKADLIEAEARIEITDLHRRAAVRWLNEEAQRQLNMENILTNALPQVNESAQPDTIEDDWIINFFDKSRIVSDNQMQELWSRVLAGEANSPGRFSKRTVNCLSDLDKSDAEVFTRLCGFVWHLGQLVPLVFDKDAEIYQKHGINFSSLSHLDSIGLIRFQDIVNFEQRSLPKTFAVDYYGRRLVLDLEHATEGNLTVGRAIFTNIGMELAPICDSKPVNGFWEYVKEIWKVYLLEYKSG